MPESKPSRWIALSELSHIAAVVAPSAVAVTGLLYLTGHVERVSRLGPYGIAGAFPEPSLQETLAGGYFPHFVGTLVIAVVGSITFSFDRFTDKTFQEAEAKGALKDAPLFFKIMIWIQKANRQSLYVMAAVALLSYGYFSGIYFGSKAAYDVSQIVHKGCRVGCVWVTTEKIRYGGAIIAQNAERTAIYTKKGTFIIETKDIKNIRPVPSTENIPFLFPF